MDPNSGYMEMEEHMNKTSFVIALAFGSICAVATMPTWAEETNKVTLAQSLSKASVSLDQGLRASAAQGKPISGKFEIDGDALQLSVYLAQGAKLSEVIVDHQSGLIKKAETITDIDDLKAANAQNQAMKKAQVSLDMAVRDAVTENPGYRAVSVVPTLKANRPLAEIVLLKGSETKSVFKPLD